MGKQVCLALLIYNNVDIPSESPSFPANIAASTLNKEKIISELVNNQELLQDAGEDSSGSDSDPSEDNLSAFELEIIQVATGKIPSKSRQNNLEEPINRSMPSRDSKKQNSKRILSVPRRVKCPDGEEISGTSGSCSAKQPKKLRKLFVNSKSATLVYLNPNGRKVRDQATQTIKFEESKTVVSQDSLKGNNTKLNKVIYNRSIALDENTSMGKFLKKRKLPMIKRPR